jgi:hypothetical protein
MAFLTCGENIPDYLTLITDWDKIKIAATESLEEYLVTNRFNMAPERMDVSSPIQRSIQEGYKANVKCLSYFYRATEKANKIVTKEKLLKYDFLDTAGLRILIMKAPITKLFKQYFEDKIQIIDVIITLQNGEEITDYKAVNVINRVEAFTWEGSIKGMYYNDYNEPNVSSLRMIALDRKIINNAVICKDSVTNLSIILVSDEIGVELKKYKFKGLDITFDNYGGRYKIVG